MDIPPHSIPGAPNAPAPPPVLAAEDEENDAFILRRAFKRVAPAIPLVIVPDGREAIDYLSGAGPYSDRLRHPLPCLLLLDLKMPHMNGFNVLDWLSRQPRYKQLPVVVFSSSCHEADIQKAYKMGAADYQIKPVGFADSMETIRTLLTRWAKSG